VNRENADQQRLLGGREMLERRRALAGRDGRNDGRDIRDGRGQWNGGRDGRGDNNAQAENDGRGRDGRGDWNGGRGRGDNNGPAGNGGRGRDGRALADAGRGGPDGDRRPGSDGRNWDDDRGRGRDGHGNWNGGRDGRRNWASNDWGRDGRRDWRDDDRHRGDWDRGRNDPRYRPYRNTHRDFSRPRYSDWRHVQHGHYFDHGYVYIVSGYYGRRYNWWGFDGWQRPYRRWSVGYLIPAWLYWEPVPGDLYYRLPPAPYGCCYVYADGDILLIAIATGLILDALLYY
jgi:hypothetical protein